VIQFAYPWGLLSLAAVPLILVLHLLRPRPRLVVVSTTALWRAALKDRDRGLGLRRLLTNLSLILLLAIALALGFALAGPQWTGATDERADVVLILDTSASMKTRAGVASTRFDQALAEARRIVDALPRDGRMLVMTSARKALLRTGFETDRSVLQRLLSQLRPGDEAGRPREALALALSLLRGREQGRIYFLTDGAFDADVDPGSPQVVFRIVGAAARNVAITRFDLRREPGAEDRFQVLLTVRNYTEGPVKVPASTRLEGRVLFERVLELDARAETTLVLPFDGRASGQAIARIDVDDDLAADNQAFATLDPGGALRVLLFTAGNFYLESVLEAVPNVELFKRNALDSADLAQLARSHDLVVFDGVAAPELPPGNYLLVNTVAPGLPFADEGKIARPEIVGRGQSALLRDVDLTAVRIAEARRVAVRAQVAGLQRLFWSRETDLALALLEGDVKLVYLGFDLSQSNLPLQLAFPLLIARSMEWLRPEDDGFASTHIAAGASHRILLPAGVTQLSVRTPSGAALSLAAKDGSALFDATADSGIYRYDVGDATRYFAVSLNDARESDVANQWRPAAESAQTGPADGAQTVVALWPHLLVLAALLALFEWFVWTWNRGRA
jgi:hypothetical protein